MKLYCLICLISLSILLSFEVHADVWPNISIDEVLRLTEINSPRLTASKYREIVAKKSVDIAKSNYFPTLSAEAIDDTGFAGSAGLLGVSGLMGSPFRSGYGAGLVGQQLIYDFGRTYYDVEASRHEVELSKQDTRVTLYQIKQLALQTYYECAFFRTERDIWGRLSHESEIITKEVQHFVDTGQVSIVDRYLSKAQTEEAQTAQAFFEERLKKSIKELAIIMNVSGDHFSCPPLPRELTRTLNPNMSMEYSPLLKRAMVGTKVAQARLNQEKSGFYPKIVAMASVGEMASARDVQKKAYSAGVAIELPLVDFHTSGEIQRATAQLSAKVQDVEAEKQYLGELNAKYDLVIHSSKVRLQHLHNEYELAKKAFDVAKNRYFSLEGELIDLREAFRNLSRIETAIEETRTQLLQASGSKALLNGGAG
jgi:outer membrane protein TolC